MKISFSQHHVQQTAITAIQEQNKKARPKVTPILTVMALSAIAFLVLFVFIRWYYYRFVSSYGMVVGQTLEVRAPTPGTLRSFSLLPGDAVTVGQRLGSIEPLAYERLLRERERTLDYLQETGKMPASGTPEASTESKSSDPLAILTPLERRQREIQLRNAESEILSAKLARDRAAQTLTMKREHLERMQTLRQADAVTTFDLRSASQEVLFAELALRQSEDDLQAAMQRQSLLNSPLPRPGSTSPNAVPLPGNGRGTEALAEAPDDLPPLQLVSSIAGYVTEVNAVGGEIVSRDQKLLRIVSRDNLWIDAYFPPATVRRLNEGDEARIYIPGFGAPMLTRVKACAKAALPIPSHLNRNLPGLATGGYVRLEVTGNDQVLLPGMDVKVEIDTHASFLEFTSRNLPWLTRLLKYAGIVPEAKAP